MPGKTALMLAIVLMASLLVAREVRAHCDTLDGPVVAAARIALQTHDVTPVLKWVRENEEAEVRDAFGKAIAVRALSIAGRDLADQFFFETVVRLHRLGEGEAFTGLKAAAEVDRTVAQADEALQTGNVEPVVALTTERVAAELRHRFVRVRELQRHADESVAAGRRYVAAYVDFIHFVEEVNAPATGGGHPIPDRENTEQH